jgi:hypothetical protein
MQEIRMKLVMTATAMFAALLLNACSSGDGAADGGLSQSKAGVFSQFNPVAASPAIPFPFDGLFAGFNDPTLNIPNARGVPFVTAANLQDGYSTTASAFTDFVGFVDFATLAHGILVIDTSTGAPLTPGVDFTFQSSDARDATGNPISSYRSRVLIEPLKPLKPSTRYAVAVTTGVKSVDGVAATPSDLFRVVRSATPVANQTEAALAVLSPAQKATLEALRSQLIRPLVEQLGAAAHIPEQAIVIAWTFTTESIGKTLSVMSAAATPSTLRLVNTGLRTGAPPLTAIPPGASVFVGTITIPYYLSAPSVDAPTAPLTDYWLADATKPDVGASFLGQVPCGAFAAGVTLPDGQTAQPSVSTTICYPFATKRSDQTIPVLVTVPTDLATGNPQATPAGGWPVVIFQHGITGNRSQGLAIAPALAQAGFAVIAIDLPLHGLPPGDPLRGATDGFPAPLRPTERTFDVDYADNATGAPGPDGTADASGTYFINLTSLIVSRDNLREGVMDLTTLARSLPGVKNLDGSDNVVQFNTGAVRYIGHSLGGIVGGTWLGVNGNADAATLAMPGGGVAKLLDASGAFGPRIAAGLAASGVHEGTDDYETFERFAQTLVDSGDPINYAVAAAANHPIHMIEVIGDGVVPNDALSNCPGPIPGPACSTALHKDKVLISGYLSGTDPLVAIMGLDSVGPIDVPVADPQLLLGPAARNVVVRFNQGDHASILSPAASLDATIEMQRETVNFLASNGTCLPIGQNCPAPPAAAQ